MQQIYKYPRTQHIESSNIQDGDEDLDRVPFDQIKGRHVVIEEKVDGANSGISFSKDWELQLQSRGHYLTGGPRERHFNLFKKWASIHSESFLDVLIDRYVKYGEWMYAKHTEFYDLLPHYFMEFDILDTQKGTYIDGEGKEHQGSWLSTPRRKEMIGHLPIANVLVLFEGKLDSKEQLVNLLGFSRFKSKSVRTNFLNHALEFEEDRERILAETDLSPLMEGLYIKVEEDGVVKERYKYVRKDFTQMIQASDSHWLDRPIIPNILAPDVDIFKV